MHTYRHLCRWLPYPARHGPQDFHSCHLRSGAAKTSSEDTWRAVDVYCKEKVCDREVAWSGGTVIKLDFISDHICTLCCECSVREFHYNEAHYLSLWRLMVYYELVHFVYCQLVLHANHIFYILQAVHVILPCDLSIGFTKDDRYITLSDRS